MKGANTENNKVDFGADVAGFYEQNTVPMVFAPYAEDLAVRLSPELKGNILEIAAGTGVVTRKLVPLMNQEASYIATDISQPMLDLGKEIYQNDRLTRKQADALQLPYEDESFDLVICQFGVMFFSNRISAYKEIHRVLKSGGKFIFNTWRAIEMNDFANIVSLAMTHLFPNNPPTFLSRVPHGYDKRQLMTRELQAAGFKNPADFEIVRKQSLAKNARITAEALVLGTPLRGEIQARDPKKLEAAVEFAEKSLVQTFGSGSISGQLQAYVVSIVR